MGRIENELCAKGYHVHISKGINLADEWECGRCEAMVRPTGAVKFSNLSCIVNDTWIMGGTRWSRFIYRMRHFPWVATKRAIFYIGRRIRRLFVKDRIYPL
jgi:hypothetical protein